MPRALELLEAFGHPNIRATHGTTLAITRDEWLSARGDCIIGVKADKPASGLSEAFKAIAKSQGSRVTMVLEARGIKEVVSGFGDPALTFGDDRDLVARKSSFKCPRTLMIRSDKAAGDLSRGLIQALRDPGSRLRILLIAESDPAGENQYMAAGEPYKGESGFGGWPWSSGTGGRSCPGRK